MRMVVNGPYWDAESGRKRKLNAVYYDGMNDMLDAVPWPCRSREEYYSEHFTGVSSPAEARTMALEGWMEEAPKALSIAEGAVAKVEAEHEHFEATPVYDTSGGMIDVDRYLSGEPECMIEMPLMPIVKTGKTVTLSVSICASAAVSAGALKRRATASVALALALHDLGYQLEIYSEFTTMNGWNMGDDGTSDILHSRTKVKDATDPLDVPSLMFNLGHPAMLRILGFRSYREVLGQKGGVEIPMGLGTPIDAPRELPEGTIYLPSICSDHDIPDAERFVLDKLRELEILT